MLKTTLLSALFVAFSSMLAAQVDLTIINNSPCNIDVYLYHEDAACNNYSYSSMVPVGSMSSATTSTPSGELYVEAEFVTNMAICTSGIMASAGSSPGSCTSCPGPSASSGIWKTGCSACPTVHYNWDDCAEQLEFN